MDFYKMKYNDRVEGGVGKQAEDIFEQHLTDLGLVKQKNWLKAATSPWEHNIDFFWYYTDIITIPDYIFNRRNRLYLTEVKGTKKIKFSDMEKLQELYERARDYPEVKIGITYVNIKTKKVKWYSFEEVLKMWVGVKEHHTYHEKDLKGQEKRYKILPL
tara:strand:+ start:36 stop:512 length:477 start_codon:yes stop_codon:yes gene_type:complete